MSEQPKRLPTTEELSRSDPDFLGGESSQDYMDRIRGRVPVAELRRESAALKADNAAFLVAVRAEQFARDHFGQCLLCADHDCSEGMELNATADRLRAEALETEHPGAVLLAVVEAAKEFVPWYIAWQTDPVYEDDNGLTVRPEYNHARRKAEATFTKLRAALAAWEGGMREQTISDSDLLEGPLVADDGLSKPVYSALRDYLAEHGTLTETDLPAISDLISYYIRTFLRRPGRWPHNETTKKREQKIREQGRLIHKLSMAAHDRKEQIRWLVSRMHELEGRVKDLEAARLVSGSDDE